MSRKNVFLLATLTIGVVLFYLAFTHKWNPWKLELVPVALQPPPHQRCTNVINKMLRGHWEEEMTEIQKQSSYAVYEEMLRLRGVRYGFQRPDGRCGNVSQGWYRALCHPGGPAPCCYNFQCRNVTIHNCTCHNCYDLRPLIDAEHATWRPTEEACQPHKMEVHDICHLLQNATMYFIGDSLVRHLYTAFLIAITGNEDTGAQLKSLSPEWSTRCYGNKIFTTKECKSAVDKDIRLCNNTVTLKYFELRNLHVAGKILQRVLELAKKPRALVVIGIGLDDKYNYDGMQRRLLIPMLKKMQSGSVVSPKLVWTTPHVIGAVKAVMKDWNQDLDHITKYTQHMKVFLDKHHVPVLSFFNITLGVMSHDGTHHALGVNRIAAQVLMHHIEELRSLSEW